MKVLALLVSIVFSSFAWAEDYQDSGPYYAFYHIQASNPAAVVTAMDKFWASARGKQHPADVALA